jgi:hypothetical protein
LLFTCHDEAELIPDVIGVPIGASTEAAFRVPTFLVFDHPKHLWLLIPANVTA